MGRAVIIEYLDQIARLKFSSAISSGFISMNGKG